MESIKAHGEEDIVQGRVSGTVAAIRKWRHLFLALMPAVLTMALSSACSPADTSTVPPGQEAILRTGQSMAIAGEPLEVKFAEVVGDSRCPTGALCIRQGEVTCRLEITHANATKSLNVSQPGLTREPARATFEGYEFAFDVQPYPEVGKDINKAEYRLRLTINKASSAPGRLPATSGGPPEG
jgi:hypothetical protein